MFSYRNQQLMLKTTIQIYTILTEKRFDLWCNFHHAFLKTGATLQIATSSEEKKYLLNGKLPSINIAIGMFEVIKVNSSS